MEDSSLFFIRAISNRAALFTAGPTDSEASQDGIFVDVVPSAIAVLYVQLFHRPFTEALELRATITSNCRTEFNHDVE